MKPLSKFLGSGNTEDTTCDMRIINKLIEQVDEATKTIFRSNAIDLLNEPLVNVVTAVWGVTTDKNGPTSTQRKIDLTIRPMILKIQKALDTEDLNGAKDRVIDYLIKRLAISEIVFMIECYKLRMLNLEQSQSIDIYNLADIKVAGHA
jgi:hypothetical protein